jgi:hypothetical protein
MRGEETIQVFSGVQRYCLPCLASLYEIGDLKSGKDGKRFKTGGFS